MNYKLLPWAAGLAAIVLFSTCSGFQVAGKVQSGRFALRGQRPEAAVALLREAATLDPNYVTSFMLSQSVHTYLGRAYYENRQFVEAQRSLETALGKNGDDHVARLYLGLSSIRQGNREQGLRDLENGLRGIDNLIENIRSSNSDYAQFWDIGGQIRSEIRRILAATSGGKFTEAELSGAEWVGKMFDEEIEKVHEDDLRNRQRRGRDS